MRRALVVVVFIPCTFVSGSYLLDGVGELDREELEKKYIEILDTSRPKGNFIFDQNPAYDLLSFLSFLFDPRVFGRPNYNKESVRKFAKVF